MLTQRLRSFKPVFVLLDCCISFLATSFAALFYFYVLAPHKRFQVSPDDSSIFAPASLFPEEWGFVITYGYLTVLISISQIIVFTRIGLYQMHYRFSPFNEFTLITRGVLFNLSVVLTLLFFYRGTSFSRNVFLLIPIITIIFISLGHRAIWFFVETFYMRSTRIQSILLIGTGKAARELFNSIEKYRSFGYQVAAVIGSKPKLKQTKKDGFISLYKGNAISFASTIKKYKPSLVIYAAKTDAPLLESVIRLCDQEGIHFNIVPDLTELISAKSHMETINGLPLLICHNTPLQDGYNQFIKRAFDICFAAAVFFVTSPIFFIVALSILICNGRPIFFRQERVGLNHKVFGIWKFRTMVNQSQKSSDRRWSKNADQRITRLGYFLRKSSLDELPQFWNVLVGDMSIVGPRPERPFFVKKFKSHYKQYMRRHTVKSGITGWAQIQGLRGDTSISRRVSADIYYIENWSFSLDLLIALKTLPSIMKNPGT